MYEEEHVEWFLANAASLFILSVGSETVLIKLHTCCDINQQNRQ